MSVAYRSTCRLTIGQPLLVDISIKCRSTYRPMLNQCVGWYVDRHISVSTDTRSTYWPTLDWYVSWHWPIHWSSVGRGVHKIHMIQFFFNIYIIKSKKGKACIKLYLPTIFRKNYAWDFSSPQNLNFWRLTLTLPKIGKNFRRLPKIAKDLPKIAKDFLMTSEDYWRGRKIFNDFKTEPTISKGFLTNLEHY